MYCLLHHGTSPDPWGPIGDISLDPLVVHSWPELQDSQFEDLGTERRWEKIRTLIKVLIPCDCCSANITEQGETRMATHFVTPVSFHACLRALWALPNQRGCHSFLNCVPVTKNIVLCNWKRDEDQNSTKRRYRYLPNLPSSHVFGRCSWEAHILV